MSLAHRASAPNPLPEMAAILDRLAPLVDVAAGLKTIGRGTVAWQTAVQLLLVLSEAEMLLLLPQLASELGPLAPGVTDALLGVLRAALHPVHGSPTIRDSSYRLLLVWARELRVQPRVGRLP